jgi:hypothetical protein
MSGGTISGNTAAGALSSTGGGGVYVNSGSFTMSGGTISGNTAEGTLSSTGGGGVYVHGGSFTMSGGTISGNTANNLLISYGGGVYVTGGTFTKTGGTIYGDTNTAHTEGDDENTAGSGNGHAVYVQSGPKKRNSTAGPSVNLDSAQSGAAGGWESDTPPALPTTLYVSSTGSDTAAGTETAPFATVGKALETIKTAYAGNWPGKGTSEASPARILISGTVTGTGGTKGMVDITDTALYTAYPPITLEGKGTGTNAGTLDANSHSRVLSIQYADVTLGANLTLTGGSADSGGGVYVNGSSSSFTMTGGTISGNEAVSGGGVWFLGNVFTMTGGSINENTSTGGSDGDSSTGSGGGVLIRDGNFTMGGTAEISGNEAVMDGGGVWFLGDAFTMAGGTISGNKAKGTNSGTNNGGGGVYVWGGSFTMRGGIINGNEASAYGGGVYIFRGGGIFVKNDMDDGDSGTIYGNDEAAANKNTAGNGHAVYVQRSEGSDGMRNTTAGPSDKLNSATSGEDGGWE